jgi:hypothetical protein
MIYRLIDVTNLARQVTGTEANSIIGTKAGQWVRKPVCTLVELCRQSPPLISFLPQHHSSPQTPALVPVIPLIHQIRTNLTF